MKKTSTNTGRRLLPILGPAVLLLSACAFTEYGNRINQEQLAIARLEDKRHSVETEYIIVLNSLELHPTDKKLIEERDKVQKKLREIGYKIDEARKLLDLSVTEWDQKILQNRLEQEMIDKEIQDNEGKDEDVEFINK
jgi:hypothetical protein